MRASRFLGSRVRSFFLLEYRAMPDTQTLYPRRSDQLESRRRSGAHRSSSRRVMTRVLDNRFAQLRPFNQTLINRTRGSMYASHRAPKAREKMTDYSIA
jgi:hypothetical protein